MNKIVSMLMCIVISFSMGAKAFAAYTEEYKVS